MRISIGFSGPAGGGVNTSGLLLGRLLSSKGYMVFGDKEYASIIKGDNNNFFLYVSDCDPFITQSIDHFFPFDSYSVTKNSKIYTLKNVYPLKEPTVKYKNIYFFGAALKLLGIPREEGEKLLAIQFSGDVLAVNLDCLTKGYAYFPAAVYNLSASVGPSKDFMFGNECVGNGAIASGMDFYAGYPMTPASSLIDVVIPGFQKINQKISEDNHLSSSVKSSAIFFQGEDEIAVSMTMLGAKFAGKRAMCGTSGGGFALMTESIAFSHQAELGGVYILSQRDGPSTGTPTYTAQADLNYALNASFGDTFPLVLAPSTLEESYTLIGKALNRSDIYQHPVIFLIDKQFSESYLSVDKSKLVAEPINRGKLIPNDQPRHSEGRGLIADMYKRYELTTDGISPVTLPGTEHGEFIASSYEHDEYGATNEDPFVKKQQQDKRFKKLETFVQQEFTQDFYGYEIINPEATEFFITFGVNRYVLEDFINNNRGKLKVEGGKLQYGLIVIKVLQPFDMRLKEFLDGHVKTIKKLTFVEMNYSGQLQELVTNKCRLNDKKWNKKIKHIRKYTLYPVFTEDLNSL